MHSFDFLIVFFYDEKSSPTLNKFELVESFFTRSEELNLPNVGFGAVNLDKDPELILDSVSKSGLPAIVIIGGGSVNHLEFDI